MEYNSKYMSRAGKLSCSASEFFGFISDIRNLGQFIPVDTVTNWHAAADSCSFGVPPLGTVTMRITRKIPFSLVGFSGDALQKNDFNLDAQINIDEDNLAEVMIILTADLNPLLKSMASGPIEKFLDIMISEMEKFVKWDMTFKESQPL